MSHGIGMRSKRSARITRIPPLRRGRPVWLLQTRDRSKSSFPRLKSTEECDVVIVGGGMTGVLTAVTFATAGISVGLLEAGAIGRGSTAASTALLLQEPDHGVRDLMTRYGKTASVRIW